MPLSLTFSEAARLPEPGDNVAIATRRLEAGTLIAHEGRTLRLSHTIMEGHRLVVNPIAKGEALLSWGLPFGHALRNLIPGEYICNAKILNTLRNRNIDFALPEQENFTDFMQTYQMNPATFRPGRQLEPAKEKDTFRGYLRPGRRGVGTRNFVVLLGTSSLSASFCRTLEAQAQEWRRAFPNVDGVVAVTHTEGGTPHNPNNRELLLRSLAGFLVHANVGAVIAVERGGEVISNAVLREFMEANHYPLGDVPHEFFNLGAGFQEELKRGGESVRRLLTQATATGRTPQPASALKIALQCGGSDAFSGISGNPLAGDVARRVILQGGAANLAETDELI
ncbi:MAG: UxaA family hydrolase, partial [Deltaproteobacteria bacterium]|nr:UxaA family hydrolase [Deltaproteobacteria bacterium]